MAQLYIPVATTATLIHTAGTSSETVRLHVDTNSPMLYLGPNSSVTSSNGLPVGGGSTLAIRRIFGQTIYAISGAGGGGVKVSAVEVS